MNPGDLALIRRDCSDGTVNLSIGEPVVLQRRMPFGPVQEFGPFPYPSIDPEPELMAEISHLHGPGSAVVVANGAKQALLAAFYAFKIRGYEYVTHPAPYWPSYRSLSEQSGMMFSCGMPPDSSPYVVRVVTSPNNPDGSLYNGSQVDIWDHAYAGPLYIDGGHGLHHVDATVEVMSASKLLGLSGVRVGWLVTSDLRLAELAAHYVEMTTSGVSLPSQRYVAKCLRTIREAGPAPFWAARNDMFRNAATLECFLKPHLEQLLGFPDSGRGMFAWVRVKDPGAFRTALEAAKVAMLDGRACGMEEDGWWRISVGQDCDLTERAARAVAKELA